MPKVASCLLALAASYGCSHSVDPAVPAAAPSFVLSSFANLNVGAKTLLMKSVERMSFTNLAQLMEVNNASAQASALDRSYTSLGGLMEHVGGHPEQWSAPTLYSAVADLGSAPQTLSSLARLRQQAELFANLAAAAVYVETATDASGRTAHESRLSLTDDAWSQEQADEERRQSGSCTSTSGRVGSTLESQSDALEQQLEAAASQWNQLGRVPMQTDYVVTTGTSTSQPLNGATGDFIYRAYGDESSAAMSVPTLTVRANPAGRISVSILAALRASMPRGYDACIRRLVQNAIGQAAQLGLQNLGSAKIKPPL